MPHSKYVILPENIRHYLKHSGNVNGMSEELRDLMHEYAGNPEKTCDLLIRHTQRLMRGEVRLDATKKRSTIPCDPNLDSKFTETAKQFEVTSDYLLTIGIYDRYSSQLLH